VATVINLGALGSRGFTVRGAFTDDRAGIAVSAADLNGDGYDELIIGASDSDAGGSNSGQVFALYGKASGFEFIDLEFLDPADGFTIIGDDSQDDAGGSVSFAGDVNGDGIEDIIIGAFNSEDVASGAGSSYVIFGTTAGFADIDLTTLSPTAGFVIQGEAFEDRSGYDVSSAGDVNGDGLDDLIVGSIEQVLSSNGPGKAYIIYGTTGAFGTVDGTGRSTIYLSSLSASVGSTITGDVDGDTFGRSVDSAGDFNGDGYDDVIVGARFADAGGADSGRAYILYGSAAGIPSVDVSSTPEGAALSIFGDTAGDKAGQEVSGVGDVNGDGFDDVLIGAPYDTDGGYPAAGAAYVIFGAAGRSTVDLSFFGAGDGFVIKGDDARDLLGTGVASAGDFNGDGFNDVLIGAVYGDDYADRAGQAYLVFGKASGFGTLDANGRPVVDLSNLAEDTIILNGIGVNDRTGSGVAFGDLNGDGFDDLIVGSGYNDLGAGNAGQTYVVFGSGAGDFPLIFDLPEDISLTSGIAITGDAAGDGAGFAVSSAGDFNGDGFDDFLVGAPFGDDNGGDSGEAYLIFGKAGGIPTIDLADLTPAQGIVIRGDSDGGDRAGFSLGAAGDVNNDGFADIVVGAVFGEDGGAAAGETYVIFGKDSGLADIDLGILAPAAGFVIQGDASGDVSGWSVSGAGDVNNDGFADIIVGAPGGDDGGDGAGEAYVLFGKASGFGTIDLTTLTLTQGFVIQGDSEGDEFGINVRNAGDVNGDGFDDVIGGAWLDDGGGSASGQAFVVFGRASGFANIDLTTLAPSQGFFIQGDAASDYAGYSVSAAGDFNGDGFDDMVVGAKGGGSEGRAYVVFGHGGAFANVDLTGLAPTAGLVIQGDLPGDGAGFSVADAGDVNGDGYDDVIVGAPFAGGLDRGRAYVIFGKASGFGTIDLGGLTPDQGFILRGDDNGDTAGYNVASAGDVNGDGLADIIVGANGNDQGGEDAGAAYVVYGRLPTKAVTRIGSAADQTIYGGAFDDDLRGAAGDDVLIGNGGNDILNGGPGIDTMRGGLGNDSYIVDDSQDVVDELAAQGTDEIRTTLASFSLAGRNVENLIGLGTVDQTFFGNSFANRISGGAGADSMRGASGNDVYVVDNAGDLTLEFAGEGTDTVESSIALTLLANVENLLLTGSANINGAGNALDNVLTGNAGRNLLNGLAGADTMRGGLGNDTYIVDNAGDLVEEGSPGGGIDTVQSAVNFILGLNLEKLILTGSANINGNGNALANTLFGNNGSNLLNGLAGADDMRGGAGNDTYIVDNIGDLVIETSAAGGTDTVQSAVSYTIRENVENLTLTGSANINGAGNSIANTINGNSGNNLLNGFAGADTLRGGLGDDVYIVDNVGDVASESSAVGGNDRVQSSVTFTLAANIETLILTGAASVNGTGNASANTINGNSGANQLFGEGGDDVLRGGDGADQLHGGLGNDNIDGGLGSDKIYFDTALNAATNVDRLVGYSIPDDSIVLDNAVFTGLAAGALAAGAFRTGSAAADADDRIIYNAATGALLFDSDGVGGAAAVQFATLGAGLAMTAGEFTVI